MKARQAPSPGLGGPLETWAHGGNWGAVWGGRGEEGDRLDQLCRVESTLPPGCGPEHHRSGAGSGFFSRRCEDDWVPVPGALGGIDFYLSLHPRNTFRVDCKLNVKMQIEADVWSQDSSASPGCVCMRVCVCV